MKEKISKILVKLIMTLIIIGHVAQASEGKELMSIDIGEANNISFNEKIGTVFISNPEVADYQVVGSKGGVFFGKEIGVTDVLVYSKAGHSILLNKRILVNDGLTKVLRIVKRRFSEFDIRLENVGKQVLVSGTVDNLQQKEEIYDLVGTLLNKNKSDVDRGSSGNIENVGFLKVSEYAGIIDNVKVLATKQVNVKLTIAEVTSSFIQATGFKWGSIIGDSFSGNGQFGGQVVNFNADNVAALISAVNDQNVGQVLAQPNLSVISGETADFLVGGEIPIVYRDSDSLTVTYKPFGISLGIAAKVLSDNKIKIQISPEVSSVSSEYSDNVMNIPSFKVRRARTTVELGDGESFVLGGLLNNEEEEDMSKLSFISEIPILGALFSHKETKNRKSELVIVATVSLVSPIAKLDVNLFPESNDRNVKMEKKDSVIFSGFLK